ncbi:MAG: NAD-dependent epimerase/dehydratase family protein [Acetobacteraceae bacterium]
MRILLTGAKGFVGRHLTLALASRFPEADLFPVGTTPPEGADIADAGAVDALVKRVQPTHLVHLAAIASVPEAEADPRRAFAVNQGGPLNLCLTLLSRAPACRLLLISSSEVYGRSFNARQPLAETAPLLPSNVYAASKAAGEMAALGLVDRGLRMLIVRPFSHTGPGQSTRFALPAFAAQIVAAERGEQEPVIRTGRLDAVRDFMDVRDVVAAYALLLERFDAIPSGTAINVATGTGRTIEDLLAILLGLARIPVRPEIDPTKVRPHDVPWTVGDAARARALLDWAPTIPIERTLADLLDTARSGSGHWASK